MWPSQNICTLKEKLKVLIVGAGLTGCLTSYLLNKELGDHIDLHILEKSPYPSGRFGAGLRYKNEIKGGCFSNQNSTQNNS